MTPTRALRFGLCCAVLLITVAGEEEADDNNGRTEEEQKWHEEVAKHAYCYEDNCYELLGVKPEANAISLKRAYRRLATEWHPDKNPDPRAKELFQKYANAYDVVGNPEMRKAYDYLLSHPYEFPMHFLRYSRPSYAPKSDLRLVLLVTILGAAAVQYFIAVQSYQQMVDSIKSKPRYQDRLKQLIAAEVAADKTPTKKAGGARGEAGSSKHGKKDNPKGDKLEMYKKAAEAKLEAELAEGLPKKPRVQDTLLVSVFKLPLTITYEGPKMVGWFVKFTLLRQAYGPEEKAYLTRKALEMSLEEWEGVPAEEKDDLCSKELWISENLEALDNAAGGNKSKSGKEKRAARLKKRGGSGQVNELLD